MQCFCAEIMNLYNKGYMLLSVIMKFAERLIMIKRKISPDIRIWRLQESEMC